MSRNAILAETEALWRERLNRSWRFSPVRSGLWILLVQVGLAAAMVWRLDAGSPASLTAGAALLAMLVQAGVWSFISAFLTGRNRLFGHRDPLLLFATPAPPWTALPAGVLADLPRRAWSMLIWSGALAVLLPATDRLWAMPTLWVAGLVVGALGHLAGTMALVAWVAASPRSLAGTTWVVLMLQLALLYYLIYLIATGVSLTELGAVLGSVRTWLALGLALLLGIPGLIMVGLLTATPGRLSDAYRDAWLGISELDGGTGRRRSHWPALCPGAAGAVQTREWLYGARNPFTYVRLSVIALLLLALVPAAPFVQRLATIAHDLVVFSGGLGLIYFAFGEMIAASFTNEGGRLALHMVAGVRPRWLLLGKVLAVMPYAVLSGLAVCFTALAAGDAVRVAAAAAAQGAGIGLGMVGIMVGLGALDARLQEPEEIADAEGLAAAIEQVPQGPFSIGGMVVAGAYAAGFIWWNGAPAGLLLLWALPLLCLGVGGLRLLRVK